MSFVFGADKATTKNLCAKTHGMGNQVVYLTIFDPNGDKPVAQIGMKHFCALVYYVLTNADLESNDPRRRLFECIQKAKLVPGRNAARQKDVQRIDLSNYAKRPQPKPNVPIATRRLNTAIKKHDSNGL